MEFHLITEGATAMLVSRKRELLEVGGQNQQSVETAKMSLFAATLGGVFLSASIPFIAVPVAAVCGVAYAVALMEEMKHTGGGLRPLPVCRADLMEFIESQTSGEIDDEDGEDFDEGFKSSSHVNPKASYLGREELSEYLLLDLFLDEVSDYLESIDEGLWVRQYTRIVKLFDKSAWSEIARKDPGLAMQNSGDFLAEITRQKQLPPSQPKPTTRSLSTPPIDEEDEADEYSPPQSPTIGVNTRLQALQVPARPVNPVEPIVNPSVQFPSPKVDNPWDVVEPRISDDIVDKIIAQGNSLVFMGGQGVGKSRLMAIASQKGQERGKFKNITVCSGLAKPGEDPIYWQHCGNQLFFDLAPMPYAERVRHLQEQLRAIQNFKAASNESNPGLLILDEIAYLASILASAKEETVEAQLSKEICDTLRVVCSGGAKRGWFVWVGTPQGAIGSMGEIGRELKRLKLVFCAIAPMSTVQSRGHDTTWDEGLQKAAKRNWDDLNFPPGHIKDRIVYFDSNWYQQTAYQLQESIKKSQSQPLPPSPTTPKASQSNLNKIVEEMIGMVDLSINQNGSASAGVISGAIQKKTGVNPGAEKVGRFLYSLTVAHPEKYELVPGLGQEVAIRRKQNFPANAMPQVKRFEPQQSTIGTRDTPMTGLR